MGRLIDADALKEKIERTYINGIKLSSVNAVIIKIVNDLISDAPTIEVPKWIPCEERLPKIGERVLLATNCGIVVIGHRDKPDLIWQVTEKGDKHWVYDPEAYTDDVDSLPKGEDCAFSQDTDYGDGFLSVTSLNYNPRFEGVIAWMPLPQSYEETDHE